MDPIDEQFAAFSGTLQIVEILGLGFLFALVSETVWDVIRGTRGSLRETFANATIAVVSALLERTFYGVIFVLGLVVASYFAFADLPTAWWTFPLAVLVADLTYYWMHRCEHEVRIFWANHSVHHSSPEFNFSTALRISWIDALIEWVFFIPMVLIGFSVAETVLGLVVVVAYQSWIHTEKVGKLGWLDRVFNTPSVHRVHHGTNAQYIDKNYGGLLIIWDRMFGTYAPEAEQVIYGITTPLKTSNPIRIIFHEYIMIAKDLRRARTLSDMLGYLFRSPGWRPKG